MMLNSIDIRCVLFNHNTRGVWIFSLSHGYSFSLLCCCYCTMAGNMHRRTQRPATHSKRAVLKCATSN